MMLIMPLFLVPSMRWAHLDKMRSYQKLPQDAKLPADIAFLYRAGRLGDVWNPRPLTTRTPLLFTFIAVACMCVALSIAHACRGSATSRNTSTGKTDKWLARAWYGVRRDCEGSSWVALKSLCSCCLIP